MGLCEVREIQSIIYSSGRDFGVSTNLTNLIRVFHQDLFLQGLYLWWCERVSETVEKDFTPSIISTLSPMPLEVVCHQLVLLT